MFTKKFTILILGALTVGFIFASGVSAQQQKPVTDSRYTTVTVSGDARVSAQPDTATVSISVVTQNESATEAQQRNASLTTAVVNALKAAAGSGAEIETSNYTLAPQRVYKENQPPTISGYEARNTVTVTLKDLTRVGAVIDQATRAGANDINSVAFSLREDRAARSRALGAAPRDAIAKAETLAQALGGRVRRIVAVQEAGTNARPPVIYARQETFSAAAKASADTPIEVGALEINSRVELVAEVEIGAGNSR